jgi:hypothetical protein
MRCLRSIFWTIAMPACVANEYSSGASEPFKVPGATFKLGDLPSEDAAVTPLVVNLSGVSAVVTQGQGEIAYSGVSSPDTYAIGVAFQGIGDGYWVVPVQGPDVTQNNGLVFEFDAEFTREVPFGLQELEVVAFDALGQPGPRYTAALCILPEASYGSLAACDPSVSPQSAVISLRWDADVDLDLIVLTPEGKIVYHKAPTTAFPNENSVVPDEDINDPSTGTITRDSNRDCDIDGLRLESLVFPGPPPGGRYHVFANLSSACLQNSVTATVEVFRRVNGDGDTHIVEREVLGSLQLTQVHANGGEAIGTYVTSVDLP